MRKITLRALALLLAVIMIAGTVIGCRSDSGDGAGYVYVPEIVPFPTLPENTEIDTIVVGTDTVLFSTWTWGGGGEQETVFRIQAHPLMAMNIDGTNLRELPNSAIDSAPPDADAGWIQINSLLADNDGNFWIVESGSFTRFDPPEGFVEDPEDWENQEILWGTAYHFGDFTTIRKIDSNGLELLSVDLGAIAAMTETPEWFRVNEFVVDREGNKYLATWDGLFVLNSDGEFLTRIDIQDTWGQLHALSDGTVLFDTWEESGRSIRKIDLDAGDFGEELELPENVNTILPGNDEYLFLFNDRMNLYGFDAETNEPVQLLNWIESGISGNSVRSISFLDDGRLFVTSQLWRGAGSAHELAFLTRTRLADLPERTSLTLATGGLDWQVENAVIEFNRTSTTHRIVVEDYGQYSTEENDWTGGVTRLTTELTAGRIPDILDITGLPHQQYAARGMLVDLYEFIDADPELSRSALMESALRAAESAGQLHYVFPMFSISTVVGSPHVLGTAPGWNVEEFIAVLDANPQADMPMGRFTNEAFLRQAFSLGMHNFVDWSEGTVNFDGGEFAELLELASTFPPPEREGGGGGGTIRPIPMMDFAEDDWVGEEQLIAEGRQIMTGSGIWDFWSIRMNAAMFGGDVVYKGFPTANRDGNTLEVRGGLAITTSSSDPEGAWGLVRMLLHENWQRDNIHFSFPTNRTIFEEAVDREMNPPPEEMNASTWINGVMVEMVPPTQAQIDQLYALIDSVSGVAAGDTMLWNIISEIASEFFEGAITAENAARIIQDRAAIYVSELS